MRFPKLFTTSSTLSALRSSRPTLVFLALAFVFLRSASTICGQLPDIENIEIKPPNPTVADPITLSVSGMMDIIGQQIIRSPWRININDILVDVLVVDLPILAPSIPGPFIDESEIGLLPAGSYDLTARLFLAPGGLLTVDPFPDPWEFPDSFLGEGPVDSMATQFTVVPEPSALALAAVAVLGLFAHGRRHRRA